MLKKIVFVVTGTIVIISVWFLTLDTTTQTNYQTLQLKNQTIQTSLKEKGIIVPQNAEIIISKTNGLISNVLVEEGDTVKKNDVLMHLELKDKHLIKNEFDIQLKMSAIKLAYTKRQYNAQQALFEQAMVSELELEAAKNQYDITLKENDLLKLQYSQLNLDLSRHQIRSPIKGTIVQSKAIKGTAAQKGSVMFTVADLCHMVVQSHIKENASYDIKLGQRVNITGLPFGETVIKGEVIKIYPKLDTQFDTTRLKIETSIKSEHINKTYNVRPGNQVNVEIITEEKKNIPTLPIEAIKFDGDKTYVWLEKGKDKIKQYITLGLKNRSLVEIRNGLTENDLIIVDTQ